MKFLCLGYYDEKKWDARTPDDEAAIRKDCQPHDEALRATGRMLMVASLALTTATVSIRPRNGKPMVTEGPFAETKEQIGSFFLIEAENVEEAIAIASKHPAANLNERLGWGIEIRPIEFFAEA